MSSATFQSEKIVIQVEETNPLTSVIRGQRLKAMHRAWDIVVMWAVVGILFSLWVFFYEKPADPELSLLPLAMFWAVISPYFIAFRWFDSLISKMGKVEETEAGLMVTFTCGCAMGLVLNLPIFACGLAAFAYGGVVPLTWRVCNLMACGPFISHCYLAFTIRRYSPLISRAARDELARDLEYLDEIQSGRSTL